LEGVIAGDAVGFAEAFATRGFAVAIVAIGLTFGDGFAFAAALRRRNPDIAILLLGDPAAGGAMRSALAVGASDLLPLSVDGLATLADRLRQLRSAASTVAPSGVPLHAPPAPTAGVVPPRESFSPALPRVAAEMAHDMREPLRTIRLLLERVESHLGEGNPPAAQALVARLYDATTRLEDLIDGTLADASRVGDDSAPSSHADRVLDEVIAQLQASVEESGGRITRDQLPELGLEAHQLRQILQNLVANALRYGGDPPWVHVSARRDDDAWILSVRDNGPGIPADQREAIFRPFTRLVPGGAPGGHGLGLSICAKVVRRAGGRIWVEEAPGGGSVFRVLVPNLPIEDASERILGGDSSGD
jgi:signal transduction histidine kinase